VVQSNEQEDLIHKAAGWMLREAGKRDMGALCAFLDEHASAMPRVMLRYSIEKMDTPTRKAYLGATKTTVETNQPANVTPLENCTATKEAAAENKPPKLKRRRKTGPMKTSK